MGFTTRVDLRSGVNERSIDTVLVSPPCLFRSSRVTITKRNKKKSRKKSKKENRLEKSFYFRAEEHVVVEKQLDSSGESSTPTDRVKEGQIGRTKRMKARGYRERARDF